MGRLGSGVVSKKRITCPLFFIQTFMIFKIYDCCKLFSLFMKIIDIEGTKNWWYTLKKLTCPY